MARNKINEIGMLPDNKVPYTLEKAVLKGDGTKKTLEDDLKDITNNIDDIIIKIAKQYSKECKTYKGILPNSNLGANGERSDLTILEEDNREKLHKGDFWLYKPYENEWCISIDCQVVYPGDFVYFDGKFFRPINLKNRTYTDKTTFDVIIAGGGAGGIGAAYALKDSGLRICVIDKNNQLGGTHLVGGVSFLIASPIGDWYKKIFKEGYDCGKNNFVYQYSKGDFRRGEGDEFEQLWRGSLYYNSAHNYQGAHLNLGTHWMGEKYYKDLSETETILLNTKITQVYEREGKIYGVKTTNPETGIEQDLFAEYYIDCSGDGILCTMNSTEGVDYYLGSDSKETFNEESLADNFVGDRYGINTVELCYRTKGIARHGDEVPTQNMKNWKKFSTTISGVNFGTNPPDGDWDVSSKSKALGLSAKEFIDGGQDYAYHIGTLRAMDFFHKIENENSDTSTKYFGGGCEMLAIRESNRINCDEMQIDKDVVTRITSSNYRDLHTIALATWWVDIHNNTTGVSLGTGCPHGIKYENLIPKKYKNVLVACRAFGCSHIAQSASRLVKTMMSVGYAAGHAINSCIKDLAWTDDVRNVDIAKLQDTIKIKDLIEEIEEYFSDLL